MQHSLTVGSIRTAPVHALELTSTTPYAVLTNSLSAAPCSDGSFFSAPRSGRQAGVHLPVAVRWVRHRDCASFVRTTGNTTCAVTRIVPSC